jgi:anti-sigma B factor antagonist
MTLATNTPRAMPENAANLVTRDVVLVLSITAPQVRGDEITGEIERALAAEVDRAEATRVVVDMSAVTFISSAGFRSLLGLYHKLKGVGGRVVLCGLTDMVSDVLHVMRFIDASGIRAAPFEVQPDLPAAVVSLLTRPAPAKTPQSA